MDSLHWFQSTEEENVCSVTVRLRKLTITIIIIIIERLIIKITVEKD